MMFLRIASASGPSVMPSASATTREGKTTCFAAQEKLGRLTIEDEQPADLRARQPVLGGEALHPLVERVAAQALVGPVEEGQVELGECGHRGSVWVRGAVG